MPRRTTTSSHDPARPLPRRRTTGANDNIFIDLGFPPLEAASLQIRARLMVELIRVIRSRKLTQAAAAKKLGVSQPRISDLMRAKVDKFSSDALNEMLALAGVELDITAHRRRSVA